MTVPFRPGGVDPGPDFLSTLTRSFLQARALVDEDVERRRSKQRFETEQLRENMRIEGLAQELGLRERAAARDERAANIAETRDRSVLSRDEIDFPKPTLPFAPEEVPAGGDISNQLADALGGVQDRRQVGPVSERTPEGIVPVRGQPGTYLDIDAEQRESERSRAQEAVFVSDQMEAAAVAAERAGDPDEAKRIRGAIPRAVLDIQQGRAPQTSELLLARERRDVPTAAQQETIDRDARDTAAATKVQEEDAAIERALQESAHRRLQEMGDPAGSGGYVEGRDYERQLEHALEAERRQETARTGVEARESAKPPLSLREAVDMVKDDPDVWKPTTGYKISLSQVIQRAQALILSATPRGPGETLDELESVDDPRIVIYNQEEYDAIVEEAGEEYAQLMFRMAR